MQLSADKNKFLIGGAIGSAIASLVHLGCVVFGGDWYRVLGAGEQMAQMAESGHWYPPLMTSMIALVLLLWTIYALSGAKMIIRLPFLKLGLVIISLIYLVRGFAFVAIMPMFPGNSFTFWVVSSGICIMIGTLYAIGTFQSWSQLSLSAEPNAVG